MEKKPEIHVHVQTPNTDGGNGGTAPAPPELHALSSEERDAVSVAVQAVVHLLLAIFLRRK